ncbi:MAG TPA: diaminopimelate epimerase [Methylococcaceae bacterium]|nr:diaminopimelate epimerase [Methylococcaceae bacterium]
MLAFTKMHGLGNDFMVVDAVRQRFEPTPEIIRRWADRHFGVGFDQLLLVEPPIKPGADFHYRIFNADGGEVAQCGNGARCFARFVRDQGLIGRDTVVVDTRAGRMTLQLEADGAVTVDMGPPRHAPAEIPLRVAHEAPEYAVSLAGREWHFGALSVGNPHAVLRVDNVDTAPVATLGPALEAHPLFPERVNVGFMEVVDRGYIRLRVFERGSGETLACGSGACAAAVSGMERGWLDSPVAVDLPGGRLHIAWAGRGQAVRMTGPAVTVFEGRIGT